MYPTRKKIFARRIKYRNAVFETLIEWKIKNFDKKWSKFTEETRQNALSLLVLNLRICYLEIEKPIAITFLNNQYCHFNTATNTINICSPVSIISTLHEFAHWLHGSSEVFACRWSVQLFKKVFKKSARKLTWHGHMLIKQ